MDAGRLIDAPVVFKIVTATVPVAVTAPVRRALAGTSEESPTKTVSPTSAPGTLKEKLVDAELAMPGGSHGAVPDLWPPIRSPVSPISKLPSK